MPTMSVVAATAPATVRTNARKVAELLVVRRLYRDGTRHDGGRGPLAAEESEAAFGLDSAVLAADDRKRLDGKIVAQGVGERLERVVMAECGTNLDCAEPELHLFANRSLGVSWPHTFDGDGRRSSRV